MTPKIVVGVAWLFGLVSLWMGGGILWTLGRTLFWILVVVHAVECVVFLPRLRAAGGSLRNHLVNTFLFGIVYVQTLPRLDSQAGA